VTIKEAGIMKTMNRKLWTVSIILAATAFISSAAIAGGFEGALAALGATTLAGMAGTGVHVYLRVRRSSKALKVASSESGVEAKQISNKDKTSIIKHLDELFKIEQGWSEEEPAGEKPISSKDKRLIMAHIDELFIPARKEDGEELTGVEPISEKDKKLIMADIDRLFDTGGGQNKHIFA
jgi:hypothetical protein